MNKRQLTDAEQQELLLRMKRNYTYDATTGRLTSSRLGRAVRGAKRDKKGYLCVYCCLDKKRVHIQLHHAVWAVCKGRFPERQIDHVNGNKQDNRIENLREVDPSENNTANYIQFCAKEVGTLADNRLERYTEYAMLAVAMARMETSVKLTWPQVMEVMKKFNVYPF